MFVRLHVRAFVSSCIRLFVHSFVPSFVRSFDNVQINKLLFLQYNLILLFLMFGYFYPVFCLKPLKSLEKIFLETILF